jgi:ATP-binding cassette subfamily F protein 3
MLSGGERARLTLAKLILSEMNLLILDEPTNHLDIDSKEALEVALEGFDGTIITVSHDRYFISKLATRIIDMTPTADKCYSDFAITDLGNAYDELCRERERRAPLTSPTEASAKTTESSNKEAYLKNKQNAAEERKQKRRRERLEAECRELESELEKIEEEMMGEAATDYVRVAELDTRKNEIEERLLEIYEEIDI